MSFKFRNVLFVFSQVLDFYGDVIGHIRKFAMEFLDEWNRVADTVEKVRIAERNVLRAGRHLPANVFQYNPARYDAKDAVVNRHDRAMPAKMLAAAAGFRRTNDSIAVVGNYQVRVLP